MIKNLESFNEMYFNSLRDFLNVKEISNTLDFAIVESDEDISAISDYLTSLLEAIPDKYYENFKLCSSNFKSGNQLSLADMQLISKVDFYKNSEKQSFLSTLLILTHFDFSFVNYIVPENPNFTGNSTFRKSTNHTHSSYYSNSSLFKALLLRPLENLNSDISIEQLLYQNSEMAIACGFDPLVIPSRSALCRFKDKLSPLKLNAIFFFILTVIIALKLLDSFLCATDSTHILSRSNEYKIIPVSDALEMFYTHSDLNANRGHKTTKFAFHGYKVHAAIDSISRFILGFFLTPGSSNDSPLFAPIHKFVKKMTQLTFNVYAADKGYDSSANNDFIVNELKGNPAIPCRNMDSKSELEHFIFKNNVPHCKYSDLPFKTNGKDIKSNCQLWICPNASKKFDCQWLDKCNPTSLKQVRTLKTSFSNTRKYGTVDLPKSSPKWKNAYNKRVIIEQVFSELKRSYGLNSLTEFKLSSIFAHIGISMIAYNLCSFMLS